MNICILPHGRPQGLLFFSAAVVNICERVPKVGRWLNGGEPDSSTSVPDSAKEKLNDSAGVDPPAPFRCAYPNIPKASGILPRTLLNVLHQKRNHRPMVEQ